LFIYITLNAKQLQKAVQSDWENNKATFSISSGHTGKNTQAQAVFFLNGWKVN